MTDLNTGHVKKSHIPVLIERARQLGDLLERYGVVVWQSTRDMAPGPRAQTYDPDARGWRYDLDDTDGGDVTAWAVPNDPTGEAAIDSDTTPWEHLRYRQDLSIGMDAITALIDDLDRWRPDRHIASLDEPVRWCESHLRIGVCEPRHRGDLCRWCYEFSLANRMQPPVQLLKKRHRGERITQADVDSAIAQARPPRRRRRASAS